MKRIDVIKDIMSEVKDEVVITSTGMISREVCQVKDRDRNFYMMGSLGSALAIGLGLAYARPDLKVIVISGDGAVLMSLGTLILHKHLAPSNLKHYILDNNCHATTGGQKTVSHNVEFDMLAPNTLTVKVSNEKGDAPRIELTPKQIKARLCASINV